jgi:hypothetical protein
MFLGLLVRRRVLRLPFSQLVRNPSGTVVKHFHRSAKEHQGLRLCAFQ